MKNYYSLSLILFFVSSALLAQKQKRNVDSFDSVVVSGSYQVALTNDRHGTLTLEGDQKDLDKIETFVKNGELVIKPKESSWFNSWNFGKVYIEVPTQKIRKVVLNGSGSVQAKHTLKTEKFKAVLSGSGALNLDLETEKFEGILTGSGDLKVSGKTSTASYQLTGSGTIIASQLIADQGNAKVTGSGDLKMHAQSEFLAHVTGSGSVKCYGNPKKQKIKTTGSGDVYILD